MIKTWFILLGVLYFGTWLIIAGIYCTVYLKHKIKGFKLKR